MDIVEIYISDRTEITTSDYVVEVDIIVPNILEAITLSTQQSIDVIDVGTSLITNSYSVTPFAVSTTNSNPLVANTFYNLDASAGNITATLPTAVGIAGAIIRVRKTDTSANLITMATTETINESPSLTVIIRKNGWSFDFQSDGNSWKIV